MIDLRTALIGLSFLLAASGATANSKGPIVIPSVIPQPLYDVDPSQYRAAIVSSDNYIYALKSDDTFDRFTKAQFETEYLLREKDPYFAMADTEPMTVLESSLNTSTVFSEMNGTPGLALDLLTAAPRPRTVAQGKASECTDLPNPFSTFHYTVLAVVRSCNFSAKRIFCELYLGSGMILPHPHYPAAVIGRGTTHYMYGFCVPQMWAGQVATPARYDSIQGTNKYVLGHGIGWTVANFSGTPVPDSAYFIFQPTPKLTLPLDLLPTATIRIPNMDYRQVIKNFVFGRGKYRREVTCYAVSQNAWGASTTTYNTIQLNDSGIDRFIGGDCRGYGSLTPIAIHYNTIPNNLGPVAGARTLPWVHARVMFDPDMIGYTAISEESVVMVHGPSGKGFWFNWSEGKSIELPQWNGAQPVTWYYGVYKAAGEEAAP